MPESISKVLGKIETNEAWAVVNSLETIGSGILSYAILRGLLSVDLPGDDRLWGVALIGYTAKSVLDVLGHLLVIKRSKSRLEHKK